MTYFGFLLTFVGIPLVVLTVLTWRDQQRRLSLPSPLQSWSPWLALFTLVIIAVVYTTPWDNYLVATRVWWYDPNLVTGLVLGWVPIEEYTFFVVQTLLTGLWLIYLARRLPSPSSDTPQHPHLRWMTTLLVGLVWIASIAILLSGWQSGRYLGLELSWALLPIMLQLGFGADILWHHRKLVLAGIVPTTLYLSLADALAISSGTWTINPALSLQIYLGGVLPLEELLFFGLTNTLVVFGLTLAIACQSQRRLNNLAHWRTRQPMGEQPS